MSAKNGHAVALHGAPDLELFPDEGEKEPITGDGTSAERPRNAGPRRTRALLPGLGLPVLPKIGSAKSGTGGGRPRAGRHGRKNAARPFSRKNAAPAVAPLSGGEGRGLRYTLFGSSPFSP